MPKSTARSNRVIIPLSGPCKPTCLGDMVGALPSWHSYRASRDPARLRSLGRGFRLASRLNCVQLAFRSARADSCRRKFPKPMSCHSWPIAPKKAALVTRDTSLPDLDPMRSACRRAPLEESHR
jgi:hypothetical protein